MAGIGTSGFGPGGGSSRFQSGQRGSLDGRNNSFRYPSPWWDVAQMDLPRTVKHLFRWCRYHMVVNPLVSAVTKKMAAYPITKVIIDEQEEAGFDKNIKRWDDCLFRVLNVQAFQVEAGLDYFGYGNCIVSLVFPFHKTLTCKVCGFRERIKKLKFKRHWDFKSFQHVLKCPTCKTEAPAIVKDEWYKSYKDIKILRWNPSDLEIDFNPITQTREYSYKIPASLRAKVARKKKSYLEDMPQKFLEAMKKRRAVVLHQRNVFHFKAPTPSLDSNNDGWGYPLILPALKDSFYLQVMKKAQEAVMMEHLIPLDIIFPTSADANANPYVMLNLSDWKKRIELELVKWRWDPNYKPILPLPVGHQRIGGNGRALMLTQEIKAWSEHIIAGMGVPQEFVFGGLSWSGSSVSLRMLENQFMSYRDMHEHFLKHFLIPSISRFMGWKEISVHMKSFKMADDMQSKQLLMSLNQLRKVSDKTLLAEFDKDSVDELKLIEQELRMNLEIQKLSSLYNAQVQGEASQVQAKYQIKVQESQMHAQQKLQKEMGIQPGRQPGQPGMPQGGAPQAGVPGSKPQQSVNVIDLAEAWAKKLGQYEPQEQSAVLQRMQNDAPELHQLIMQKMSVEKALSQQPLPEQAPPRREEAVI